MRVAPSSNAATLLLHGAPEGYPMGHPVDGDQQIPQLRGVSENRVPEVLCAFNDRGRVADPSSAGLHFFRADEALLPIIGSPAKYALTFSPYRVVLTPDLTIGEAMAPWQRARAVALSRMAGVVWQERGLTVVPTLRWRTKHDYDNVASGIPTHSIVAVATYGSRRDPELRTEFERGLPAMVERLEPSAVLVFGSTRDRVFTQLACRTEFIQYLPPMAAMRDARPDKTIPGQHSLFEVASSTFAPDREVEVELLVAKVCEGGSRGGHPRGSNGGLEVAVCEGNMVTTERNGLDLPASPGSR